MEVTETEPGRKASRTNLTGEQDLHYSHRQTDGVENFGPQGTWEVAFELHQRINVWPRRLLSIRDSIYPMVPRVPTFKSFRRTATLASSLQAMVLILPNDRALQAGIDNPRDGGG